MAHCFLHSAYELFCLLLVAGQRIVFLEGSQITSRGINDRLEIERFRLRKNAAIASLKKFVEEKAIYSDDAVETNSGRILECIRFIEHVVHDVVVVVCGRDRVNYVSSNCGSILGIDHTFLRSLSLVKSIDVIHPDDVLPFKRCMEKLTKVTERAYDQFKFIIHYRMKDQNGRFFSVQDEKLAIKTTPKKFVFITLLRNISLDETFFGVEDRFGIACIRRFRIAPSHADANRRD